MGPTVASGPTRAWRSTDESTTAPSSTTQSVEAAARAR